MKFISGANKLPTKHEMIEDNQNQYQMLWNKGVPKRKTHDLAVGTNFLDYLNQLSEAAFIERYPKVLRSIFEDLLLMAEQNFEGYRNNNYTNIAEETFAREKYDEC